MTLIKSDNKDIMLQIICIPNEYCSFEVSSLEKIFWPKRKNVINHPWCAPWYCHVCIYNEQIMINVLFSILCFIINQVTVKLKRLNHVRAWWSASERCAITVWNMFSFYIYYICCQTKHLPWIARCKVRIARRKVRIARQKSENCET